MQILAVSGSLRAVSKNTALLNHAAALAPADVEIALYDALADLPAFNPDTPDADAPASVVDFRELLKASDGVLFSCPEYAHGVPGVLKNALDWVVGSGELYEKPVAVFNPSPRSVHAQDSLRETLRMMGAVLVEPAALTLAVDGKTQDEIDASLSAEASRTAVLGAITHFAGAIAARQPEESR